MEMGEEEDVWERLKSVDISSPSSLAEILPLLEEADAKTAREAVKVLGIAVWSTASESGGGAEIVETLLGLALRHEHSLLQVVLKSLLAKLRPDVRQSPSGEEEYAGETEVVRGAYALAQSGIIRLLALSPLARHLFITTLSDAMPSMFSPNVRPFADYVGNLLQLSVSLLSPSCVGWGGGVLAEELVMEVMEWLLEADVELWLRAEEAAAAERQDRISQRLDLSLNFLLLLLSRLEGDAKAAFLDILMKFFRRRCLSTSQARRVPFVYFYLASESSEACGGLLKWLWREAGLGEGKNEQGGGCKRRQASLCYLADLIARGAFVGVGTTRKWLGRLSSWASSYLAQQEDSHSSHTIFYAVAHAIFFILGFRHADLVKAPDDVAFLQELELDRLVHSRPAPLRHCPLPVALTFVAVARRYQLVWCRQMVDFGRAGGEVSESFAAVYPFEPLDLPTLATFFPPRLIYRSSGGLGDTPWLCPDAELLPVSKDGEDSGLGEEKPRRRRREASGRISFCDEADLDSYSHVPGFQNYDPMELSL